MIIIPETYNLPRTDFASGGGFSNYFEAPDYQLEVVNKYLTSSANDYDGLFNRSGRGYPDVAAQVCDIAPVIAPHHRCLC
jgi:tripeptidyl-peptidase-1